MREVNRTALVPFSAQQMFTLVDDVASYPQFVPWVKSAKVLERSDQAVVATLEMSRIGVHERFTTRNILMPFTSIEMHLVDGPFRMLEGIWSFSPIELNGESRGSRISLGMRFEFKSSVIELMLSKVFEASCNSLIDAFTRRARELHAKSATGSLPADQQQS
jgi:ribosome-associated toxin RatA of RatAB toxin-antitoxin module